MRSDKLNRIVESIDEAIRERGKLNENEIMELLQISGYLQILSRKRDGKLKVEEEINVEQLESRVKIILNH